MTKTTTQKSAHITMRAGSSTLSFLASAKKDGTVKTTATVRDADKKLSRGCTERHPDMDAAKVHLAGLAKKAEALGWQRRTSAKADAFNTLPSAPKQVKK